MTGRLRPAAFLDRDGTLIEERHYLRDPEGVALLAGVPGALRRIRAAGFLLVVITNQSGIGRGLFSEGQYHAVRSRLDALLEEEGIRLDGTWHCPDDPVRGVSRCRKPAPALYRDAAHALSIDLAASLYIGDRLSDLGAATELGGRGILVRTGYGSEEASRAPSGTLVMEDLEAVARWVEEAGASRLRTASALDPDLPHG